jgi:CDP-glucose 4,6-dehydratase
VGQWQALGSMGEKINNIADLPGFFKGKKVLVTGHTGFKGSWLAKILLTWGADVTGVSLPPHTEPSLFTVLSLEKEIHNYFTDVRDYQKLQKIFSAEKPEIVFHLAAQAIVKVSYDDPLRTYETNVIGTANVLQSIRNTPSVKSAVIITSDKAYDNVEWVYPYRETDKLGGQDPYSASKGAADIITQSFIKSFLSSENSPLLAITRAGNVIGGGDWSDYRIVPDLIRSVYETKKPLIIRSPTAIRPWQFVLEPLSGYLLLAQNLYKGDKSLVTAWNFGPEDENFVPVSEIVEKGIKILGKGSYQVDPVKTFHEATLLKLDISKARTLLKWSPHFGYQQTMDYTFGWYRNYYEKLSSPVAYTENQIKQFFSPES